MDAIASSSTHASSPSAEMPVKSEPHPPSLSNGSTLVSTPARSAMTSSAPPPQPLPPASERQLEVKDALSYLDEVKKRFDDRPDVYNNFLDIMKDFKSQILTTPDVIERVSALFRGHPQLISGFNTFLPPGYRIECSLGENQRITVTTPSGTLTQNATGSLTQNGRTPGPPPAPPAAPPPKQPSEPPHAIAREAEAEVRVVERTSVPPATEGLKREVPPPLPPPAITSRPSTRPPTPIPVASPPPPPPPRSRAPTPPVSTGTPIAAGSVPPTRQLTPVPPPVSSSPSGATQPPPPSASNLGPPPSAVGTPSGGSGQSLHPSHIPLPPLSQTIAGMPPGPPAPLVLTPAVALNSSQTTASAASVLGGMHLVTSNQDAGVTAIQQQQQHQQHQQQQLPPSQQSVYPPAAFHPSLSQGAPPPPSMVGPMQAGAPAGGPMPGPGMQSQQGPQPEFYHAIQYINRIKTRFSDEPETYKQFLEILQTYQKEQRLLHDSHWEQVYAQVTQLFRNAPELIDEFKMFLPDTSGTVMTPGLMTPTPFGGPPPGGTVGVMGMIGQHMGGIPGQTPSSGTNEWTVDVNSMSVKPDKLPSTFTNRRKAVESKDGPPTKKRRKGGDKDALRTEKDRERDRERENIPLGMGSSKLSSSARPRQPNSRAPEPSSPTLPQFGRSNSPINGSHIPPHPLMHVHPSLPPHSHQVSVPSTLHAHAHAHALSPVVSVLAAPELFFDRVNRALDDRDAWEEFLKLLTLFSSEIIDENMLVRAAAPFLGGPGSELEQQFREMLGMDRYKKGKDKQLLPSHTASSSAWLTGSKSKFGPSYRRLPELETTLACSGRDELARSVLNDEWVSHPVWASEEAGFVAHKKNIYEEALHRTEDERHEFHVCLESMAHTISLLEPIAFKLEQMTNDERVAFRLSPELGSRSKSIYEKIIRRVYGGTYNAQEVLQCLQESPAVAVPVVLHRLKFVDAEWRRVKRDWEKHWREIDSRNFYKSLDHQGLSFKVNDKKAITGKAFLADIERIKKAQDRERDGIIDDGENEHIQSGFVRSAKVLPRRQLEYEIEDLSVLQDTMKLSMCFLERNDQRQGQSNIPQYNAIERRRIEAFLRHYVMYQFGLGTDFDAAFGPPIDQNEWEDLGLYVVVDENGEESAMDDEDATRRGRRRNGKRSSGGSSAGSGFSDGDLNKKLSKVKKAGGQSRNDAFKANSGTNTSNQRSPNSSRLPSPVPDCSVPGTPSIKSSKQKGKHRDDTYDIWLRHVEIDLPFAKENTVDALQPTMTGNGSFFCNTNFYTLLRLLQLLYSRLMMCKNMAARLAKEGSKGFRPNPVAYNLGLVDTAGPVDYLAAISPVTQVSSINPAEHFYVYLLDLIEKVFDGELEQSVFEENMRFMFGTKAFLVFTLDKLCGAICKQVQAVVQESRCHELMNMYEQRCTRRAQTFGASFVQDTIRYRRHAESLVGSDDLFRIDWTPSTKKLRIQLLDTDDLSLDPPPALNEAPVAMNGHDNDVNSRMMRWKQYVYSYVLRYPTEGRRIGVGRKAFLKRSLLDEDSDEVNESTWLTDGSSPNKGLQVMISPSTCKLFFTNGCEEASWRVRLRVKRNVEVEASPPKHSGRWGRKARRSSPEEDIGEENYVSEWERLKERAEVRLREQRRWMNQFDQGSGLFR